MNKTKRRVPSHALTLLAASLLLTATAQSATPAVTYQGPLVITKGGTYKGNWQSLDPKVAAVEITTSQPVVIEFSNIRSRGPLIRSRYKQADVTVRNTRGEALNPGLPEGAKAHPGYFLHLEEFKNALVENNELVGTAGMYFRKFLGSSSKGQTVKVLRNRALNIDGRYSNGPDSFSQTGFYRVQFLQLNDVRRLVDAEIAWNQIVNQPGQSRVEEVINMYGASGTKASPIMIHDNYIQGAYPSRPATDKYGGGGMMLGDGGSSTLAGAVAYVQAYNNQVVSTSNQGIAIVAGHDISAYDNRVVSSGLLPDGTPIASQNVGLIVWDMYGDLRHGTFFNNVMRNNVVAWATPLKSETAQNPVWFPHCARAVGQGNQCTDNRIMQSPITVSSEAAEYQLWQRKLQGAGVALGPAQQ